MISDGRVQVNGAPALLGQKADPQLDEICLDGKRIRLCGDKVYIMLNKPRGYVTTMKDERGRKTVADLVDLPTRVYPVGRLDMDSEGLLIMTNDGDLTAKLLHPSHEVEKTYLVRVKNYTPAAGEAMGRPMLIDGYRIRPAGVEMIGTEGPLARLRVTIHEGRNRQIRKMAQNCGMEVIRLKRIEEGGLKLGNLGSGTWRYLTEDEVRKLRGD